MNAMPPIDIRDVVALAVQAGEAIVEVYERHDFGVETKGDGSPLTLADRRAHQCIEAGLGRLTPDIPLLSEESDRSAFENRHRWDRFWMVDPLDGTREFIRRHGEFTVNIALITDRRPVLGVVHSPVLGITHFATLESGAFRIGADGTQTPVAVRRRDPAETVMVASRSHAGGAVGSYRENLERLAGPVTLASMGSSLKICLVAEGRADIYPRLGPTSEWDTAAAHCVLEAAGGCVVRLDGTPLVYNKPDILNPWFLACGDPEFDWRAPAEGIEESDSRAT